MTNSEKALAYLQLQKMDDKLDDIAIQETAELYNMPEAEVRALMQKLQTTPQYNKAIIYSARGKVGGLVYIILVAAISIGIATSEEGAAILYGLQGMVYAVLGAGVLAGLIIQLAEIRPVAESEAVELNGFKRIINQILVFRHYTLIGKALGPITIAVFTLLAILYVTTAKPYEMHEKDWLLYKDVTLEEDCKKLIRHLNKSKEEYYTLRLDRYPFDYTWEYRDNYSAFSVTTPDMLKKGEKVDVYTNGKNAVYDIVQDGNHLLNLEKRNKRAGKQTLQSVIIIGIALTLMIAASLVKTTSTETR